MDYTYEEILEYNVFAAIEMKYEEVSGNLSVKERKERLKNDPTNVPHHPLLSDYDWVYEHVEELFFCYLDYQCCQGVSEYYTFFKVIVDKYSLEEDYNMYLYGNSDDKRRIKYKWNLFAKRFVSFFGYSFDDRLKALLEKEDFINYFLRYPFIYNMEVIRGFDCVGFNSLLECNSISSYYKENCKELLNLIIEFGSRIKIPLSIMMDKNVVKFFARNPNALEFHYYLDYVSSQISTYSYIEEHKKYCDEQVSMACDGILPCLLDEYSSDEISFCEMSSLKKDVINRIRRKYELEPLNKKCLYQELSKYMIIGMFISRNYETDPYNVLIDIETLYEFANENNRPLRGYSIYDFLVNFESKSVFEVIDFYIKNKDLPLMEMLYDDWQEQRELFVNEINFGMLNVAELQPQVNESGVTYYDITDSSSLILVNNTSVSIDDSKGIEKLIEKVRAGKKGQILQHICLSLHDAEHQQFFQKEGSPRGRTIKFVYGKINPDRVGIVCHKDAFSVYANEIHVENFNYKKNMLYTLSGFMSSTIGYNELVYVIGDEPFFPLGVICEDEITDVELDVARNLNILVFYRRKREYIENKPCNLNDPKRRIKSYRHRYVKHGSVFVR